MDSSVSTFVIAIVILVIIFLILREVTCWYWKINERIELQKEQNQLLRQILNKPNTDSNGISGQSKETGKSSKSNNSNIVKTSIGDFNKDHKQKGEAFCLGCRNVDQIENLLYNEKGGKYYHLDCLKEFIDKDNKK